MKTCDCFFDIGLCAKINQLKCKELQKLFSCNRTVNFFFYYNVNQKTYIICCWDFIKVLKLSKSESSQKYQGLIVWNGLMKMIAFTVLDILNWKNTALHVKLKL